MSCAGHRGDGSQHLSAVPQQNADILQVLICQMGEYREINGRSAMLIQALAALLGFLKRFF
jgi:hypothetical protein